MIRDAEPKDIEEIVELFKVILEELDLPVLQNVSWLQLKPALMEAANSSEYRYSYKNAIVKEIDKKVVGFSYGYRGETDKKRDKVLLEVLTKHDLSHFVIFQEDETEAGEWYIDSLVVNELFRGFGIGRELLHAVYQQAKSSGVDKVGLNVNQSNPKARKLYEKEGFRKSREIELMGHLYTHMQKQV
ncbi:GNAT family N-acetyltransferase [Marinilactibacillus psychrotolerans]|uniref:GNAT family N-acetyltransferase n=2 Tax=Marinilactibacillus psychrotolerans TaxID=191770 RepID=A0ABW8UH91_9LACT|nr:GNAT family N-acetyltransferase [Marinilactibacillus psychrotolerans]SJN41476.1 Acetyltransferase (GNAT family) SAS0976 [Marinilactibacillus psychrotolerans 42ea]